MTSLGAGFFQWEEQVRVPALNSIAHLVECPTTSNAKMAINKRKLKAEKAAELIAESSGTAAAADFDANPGDIPSESTLIDGLDLSWLVDDTLDLVDDKNLHEDCLAVTVTLGARKPDFGKFVWVANYGNKASRGDMTMRTAIPRKIPCSYPPKHPDSSSHPS